jgi:hypothetical protein
MDKLKVVKCRHVSWSYVDKAFAEEVAATLVSVWEAKPPTGPYESHEAQDLEWNFVKDFSHTLISAKTATPV